MALQLAFAFEFKIVVCHCFAAKLVRYPTCRCCCNCVAANFCSQLPLLVAMPQGGVSVGKVGGGKSTQLFDSEIGVDIG